MTLSLEQTSQPVPDDSTARGEITEQTVLKALSDRLNQTVLEYDSQNWHITRPAEGGGMFKKTGEGYMSILCKTVSLDGIETSPEELRINHDNQEGLEEAVIAHIGLKAMQKPARILAIYTP
jgi:hypothetical protein